MEATQISTQERVKEKGRGLPLPPFKKFKGKKWLKRAVIVLAALAALWFFFLLPKGTDPAARMGQ